MLLQDLAREHSRHAVEGEAPTITTRLLSVVATVRKLARTRHWLLTGMAVTQQKLGIGYLPLAY